MEEYIEGEGFSSYRAVRVKNCVVALLAHLHPTSPSVSLHLLAVLLQGRVAIDEEAQALVDVGGDPTGGSCVELHRFFGLVLGGAHLDLLA